MAELISKHNVAVCKRYTIIYDSYEEVNGEDIVLVRSREKLLTFQWAIGGMSLPPTFLSVMRGEVPFFSDKKKGDRILQAVLTSSFTEEDRFLWNLSGKNMRIE